MRKYLDNPRGMSLIELLAALAIFLIFIGIIGSYSSQVQTFLTDTKNHYFKKSDIRYVEMVLQDQLADPVEMNYNSGESVEWRSLDGECKALSYHSADNLLYLDKSACESLDEFTAGTGEALAGEVISFALFNGETPMPDQNNLKGRSYKIKIEFRNQNPLEYAFEMLDKK
ncbi:prepilin-type N-terminal cleavage/methylation domain-containing protein [Peribacillus deserti]|uniref:Prepilin-type N-terminal cleavage/methylation domain-containing protein n=1 Tax=Peribacillus deserti TaxID=673318 RepID=A0ABS2QFX6_9BACI|nr:prepilin-type N-terminal cleavage/methylation domain-containing protein [Peribacillus deserti]MBM7691935.1 prepilin-type N-terminal cleavage/methylation domain-containing protein [Peribacillus deserti]